MSADNGVYILITAGTGNGLEYRVVCDQAIENINWEPDYPTAGDEDGLNMAAVIDYFGSCRVFTDVETAEAEAKRIHDEWIADLGVVEYGIVTLDYCHIPFPGVSISA